MRVTLARPDAARDAIALMGMSRVLRWWDVQEAGAFLQATSGAGIFCRSSE